MSINLILENLIMSPIESSLGNDIVNLSTARSKSKYLDQRFVKRVFTKSEQNIIELVTSPKHKSNIMWAIWAAKEASFKACQKKNPELIFSHSKFDITFDIDVAVIKFNNYNKPITGFVSYKNKTVAVKWQFDKHTVHAVAVLLSNNKIFTAWDKIQYSIFAIDSEDHIKESCSTRWHATQFLISCGLEQHIKIIRPNIIVNNATRHGPPIVCIKDHRLTTIDISLSHDHGWGAVAFVDQDQL